MSDVSLQAYTSCRQKKPALAGIAGCIVAKLIGYWATASIGSWVLGLIGVHSILGVSGFKALFVLAVIADIAGAPFRNKRKE